MINCKYNKSILQYCSTLFVLIYRHNLVLLHTMKKIDICAREANHQRKVYKLHKKIINSSKEYHSLVHSEKLHLSQVSYLASIKQTMILVPILGGSLKN